MTSKWARLTLADACSQIDYGLTASASSDPSGPKFLRITDIVSGHIDWSDVPHVVADAKTRNKYQLAHGDVVLARTGASTGASAYVQNPPEAVFASYLVRLRANQRFEPRYLAYYLKSRQFKEYMQGVLGDKSAQPNASATTMTKAPLQAPESRQEQRAIAELLGSLDDKIELNRRMSETLDGIARALFDEWFKVQESAEHNPARHQSQQLRDGLTLAHGKGLRKADRVPGPIPIYGSGGIFDYHNKALLEGPTVVVGRKGTVGRLYWVDGPSHPGDTVFYVESNYPLTYCYYLLGTLGLEEMNTDAAVPGLNRDNAYRLEVPSPHGTLIERFDSVVAPMRERIRSSNDESTTLAQLRDTLLPKLISGELRIPDAEKLVSEVT